jgi:hypothetical protein
LIRTIGQPLGNADLRVDLTGCHGDARQLAGGDDFLEAELAVAENGDKGNEHRGTCVERENPVIWLCSIRATDGNPP